MKLQPTGYDLPPEWQDLRPSFPWRRCLASVAAAGLTLLLAVAGANWYFAPPPPVPPPAAVRATQAIAQLAEESRGVESLLVMLENPLERREMEGRLLAQRGRLRALITTLQQEMPDAADRRRIDDLSTALQRWWSVQDLMLAELKPYVSDRERIARARVLLTVDSQAAYKALLNVIDRWAVRHER